MGNFNRDDRSGGRRGGFGGPRRDFGGRGRAFGGRRDFGGGRDFGRGDRPMHKAICANCGKECEVPFKPSGEKPVYCSECFEKRSREAGHDNFRERGPRNDQPQYGDQFNALSAKLDKILALLEPKPQVPTSQVEQVVEEKVTEEKPKKKKATKK